MKHFTRRMILAAVMLLANALVNLDGGVAFAAETWSYPPQKPKTPFGGGNGSKSNPYIISTAQHLANMAWMINDGEDFDGDYFIMTADIVMNDDVIDANGNFNKAKKETFIPWHTPGKYGEYFDDEFMGHFDGKGHSISGMYIVTLDDNHGYYGLFGRAEEATIKNLTITNSYLCVDADSPDDLDPDNNLMAGFVVALIEGDEDESFAQIQNCHVKNCMAETNARLTRMGGVIGCSKYNTISSCSFSGKMFCRDYPTCGGVIGALDTFFMKCDSDHNKVFNCVSDGTITANEGKIGGLFGFVRNATIRNSISKMDILATDDGGREPYELYVGGFTGRSYREVRYEQCAQIGNIELQGVFNIKKQKSITSLEVAISGFANINGDSAGFAYDNHYLYDCVSIGDIKISSTLYCTYCGISGFCTYPSFYSGSVLDTYAERCISYHDFSGVLYSRGWNDFCFNPMFGYPRPELKSSKNEVKDLFCGYNADSFINLPKGTENLGDVLSLEELKAKIPALNTAAGSDLWAKFSETDNDSYKGLPMLIIAGGASDVYEGAGTAKSPYIIKTESDLRSLQKSLVSGSNIYGKYFKLADDIYMSSSMESIGTKEHPFKGHFDGNGHAIVGLRNTLFDYMYGTVKNLAIVDCNINALVTIGALARYVGSSDCKAEIGNCYVNGTVYTTSSTDIKLAGFCYNLYSGSSIHDCYFKGLFVPQNNSGYTGSYYISGIAYDGSSSTVGEITKPGIYNCYASFDVKASGSFTIKQVAGISNTGTSNSCLDCYAVSTSTSKFDNSGDCTKLSSESDLNVKFAGKTGWLQGVYRPVLASAKKYAATTPEETPTTVYFDAIPEDNPTKNYIYNVTVSGDPYADKTVWELPNMAVYVESEQMDYITNGYLYQSADFKYKRATGAKATAGQLRYDLTQSEKGYHLVCLPGMVEKSDLPAGTKVMIVGNVTPEKGTTQQVNVVMVEDIPAGVPCFVYVPVPTEDSEQGVKSGEKISLVMRSGIVSEPQNNTYGSLKGTFSKDTTVPAGSCVSATYKEVDSNLPYFIRTTEATTAQPFTAWLEGATGDVQIVDYVLLDEENKAMTVTLAELNGKQTNLKMHRTLKKDNWNTICLPYSLSSDEISSLFGSGTLVEEFNSLEYNSETKTYTLKFTAATEMTAGTPYLIKPATADADNIFEMQNKVITCSSATTLPAGITKTVNNSTLTMQGEYNHRTISPNEATNGKSIYIISGDKIYFVDSEVEMKGFRCYFVAKETAGTSGVSMFSNARVQHYDGSTTDLRLIKADATGDADAVYDLLGRKGNAQTKGVVIKNKVKVFKK